MDDSLSDDSLICLCKKGNQTAYELLAKRYIKFSAPIVTNIVTNYLHSHFNFDDFQFTVFESIMTAYQRYDSSKGNFETYFKTILVRNLHNDVLKIINSHDTLDHSVSLDECIGPGITLFDVIEDVKADNPVSYFKCQKANNFLKSLEKSTTEDSKSLRSQVILLRSKGSTYREIANQYQISISKVRRLLNLKGELKFKDIYLHLK